MAIQEINLGRVRGVNMQNSHSDSTTEPYSANQTNNEIIDSFKYNFRQISKTEFSTRDINPTLRLTGYDNYFNLKGTGSIGNTYASDLIRSTFIDNHYYYISSHNKIKSGSFSSFDLGIRVTGGDRKTPIILKKVTNLEIRQYSVFGDDFTNVDIDCYPILIDLTEMFGAGNEPSTVEEVQQYLVPNKYYPYGRNIEPSMYVTKAEVNKNMLGLPSKTIDNNVMPNLTTARENIYYAPSNGTIYIRIVDPSPTYDCTIIENGLYNPYRIKESFTFKSVMKKGEQIQIISNNFNSINKISKALFIHSEEI